MFLPPWAGEAFIAVDGAKARVRPPATPLEIDFPRRELTPTHLKTGFTKRGIEQTPAFVYLYIYRINVF